MRGGSRKIADEPWVHARCERPLLLPDGTPWSFEILAAPDEVDVYRKAMGAVDQWDAFGLSR
jgi:hypothetical protein